MNGFADTLARNGYVVVLLDFAGHGASRRELDSGQLESSGGGLGADLDVAVRHLQAQPGVDARRTVLLGHSMGAAAVVRYAVAHPDVAATVAISLGDRTAVLPGSDRPRNLLLLVGENEFSGFRMAAQTALAARDPSASAPQFGVTYGDPAAGTARRAESVPNVEHISILYSTPAHRASLAWLDASVRPGAGVGTVDPRVRLNAAGLLLIGLLLGFYPLAAALVRRRPDDVAPSQDWPGIGAGLAGGLVLGGAIGSLVPDIVLGIAVGGWASAVFLAVGVGTLSARRLLPGRPRSAPVRPGPRSIVTGAVLGGYGALTVALPSHVGLTYSIPVPQRWWLVAAFGLCAGVLCYAAEEVGRRKVGTHALVLGLAAALVTGLAIVGIGPGFTLLVVPILVVLLVIQAGYAAILRRLGAASWVGAIVGATLLAWPVATSMPLVR